MDERLYRDIVESSPDGIWVIDLHGRTVYANPEIARIHRIPLDQLTALTVFDTLDEAGRKQFAAHLEDVRQGRLNKHEVEVQWVRSDGDIVWMLSQESALLDESGQVTALLHRFTDYTERRAMLESLRASEEALADEVSQNELMQAVASAANEAGSLIDVLRHARDLVLVHDDWERARAFVFEDGVAVPFYAEEDDRLADAGEEFAALEADLAQRSHASRGMVWDERRLTLAFPVLLSGEVYAVVVVTSAPPLWRFELIESIAGRIAEQLARVAERERIQADLARARDEAMAASRQKSEFLATMSHEIRTPLNGVIGLNDLLLRSALDSDQRRLATGVQVASRALLGVINDILDFSKIEAGRLELERVDFEVRALLDQVAAMLAEAARDKGLDIVVSCHPDVPAVLSGDPTKLAQVVTNLVSNAVKFTERGGVIVLATAHPSDNGVRLRLEVADTGVGVPPARIGGLFDPFTQADTSTTRIYGGTGLGLAISREIVEAMGGTIAYQPNFGGGSIFSCNVQLGHAVDDGTGDRSGSEADEQARTVLSGRRVLVVSDLDSDHSVLDEQLRWWEVSVDHVATLDEAVDGASGHDIVIVDLAHPERDGPLLASRLRNDPAYDGVRLLMLTAVTVDVGLLRSAGVDDVLVRPVPPSVLRAALLQLFLADSDSAPAQSDEPPSRSRGRVLVVEDNPINQLVAAGLLAALGYESVTAEDGVEAVRAGTHVDFDAVLMDVQMPNMDGYEATRAIRMAEADGSGRRRPIIAMTAAAIEGERERCLAAGMDDYLTKPVDPAALAATLEHWVGPVDAPERRTEPSPATVPPPEVPDGLDHERLTELLELDPDSTAYLDRAIDNFLAYSRDDFESLQASADAGDREELTRLAHRLAGGALNLGATAAGEALRSVELQCLEGSFAEAVAGLPRVGGLLDQAREALTAYRRAYSA